MLYLRPSGKPCKDPWLVNYLLYKDYFGSDVEGGLQPCFPNFPNDKNYLQVVVNTQIFGFYSKSREGRGSEFLTNVPGD